MEHFIVFFPIGNADSTLIKLDNTRTILIDYADMRCKDDLADKRIDLPTSLNSYVPGDFDVVCFTHLDNDHICGFSEYFHLEHALKYQAANRKKIKELWVPAAILVETGLSDEAAILRTEARYRLKQKKGIRVFSRPKKFKDWCDWQEDICFDDIKHLIVDAGSLVPGFNKYPDGLELFVHSPFVSESQQIDRNNEAIVMHATFNDIASTKVLFGSDINSFVWTDIVTITQHFGNDYRLEWDLFHLSHHCSYLALSDEKGTTQTKPNEHVKWLFETQGKERSRIISPSFPIPLTDTIQPPHRQAAAYYKSVALAKKGEFKVTMDHPTEANPQPLVFRINENGCYRHDVRQAAAASFAYHQKPARAGHGNN